MLKQIDNNFWVKEHSQKYFGLEVGTRMNVIRLDKGSIILISPIELSEKTIAEIKILGEVEHLIAPNLFHYLYLRSCQEVYPDALTTVPQGLDKKASLEKYQVYSQDALNFGKELEHFQFGGFAVPLPTGIKELNEVVFFHRASRSLILTDLAFHFDSSFPFITRFTSYVLGCYDKLRPSILEKLVIKNRPEVETSIKRILQWNFRRVVMAHGTIIDKDAKQRLKQGYEWFLNRSL